jgi:hypothetical protein
MHNEAFMSLHPIVLAVAILATSASAALAQDLEVVGLDGRTTTMTAVEIAALPRAKVTFAGHGERRL